MGIPGDNLAGEPSEEDSSEGVTDFSSAKMLRKCLSRHNSMMRRTHHHVAHGMGNSINEAYRSAMCEERKHSEELLAENDFSRKPAQKILRSHIFHYVVNVVIMANSVTVGCEIDLDLR